MAKSAGPAGLTEEQQRLVRDELDRARNLARRAGRRFPWLRDEFEGAALLALCEAATRWDPDGGTKWSTWAHQRIWGSILDLIRRERPLGYTAPARDGQPASRVGCWSILVPSSGEGGVDPADQVADTDLPAELANASRRSLLDELDDYLDALDKPHRYVAHSYIVLGRSPRRIAFLLGWGEDRVREVLRVALAQLRELSRDESVA